MRRVAYLLRFYPGLTSIINSNNGTHLRLLEEVIPNVKAKEKLDSGVGLTKDNIKGLVLLAYDDPELAEELENKYLLASMPTRK